MVRIRQILILIIHIKRAQLSSSKCRPRTLGDPTYADGALFHLGFPVDVILGIQLDLGWPWQRKGDILLAVACRGTSDIVDRENPHGKTTSQMDGREFKQPSHSASGRRVRSLVLHELSDLGSKSHHIPCRIFHQRSRVASCTPNAA